MAYVSGLCEVRYDVDALQRSHRLQGQELRITGTDAYSDQPARGAHSPDLAKALSAAAAIALPPSRPRIVR